MKVYISNFKLKFISELQYRSAAIAGIITQIFFGLVFIMVYVAFYESGKNTAPVTLEQTVSYIWLNQIFFSMIYLFYKDWDILNQVKTGTISYELIRPKNLYFMWSSKILGTRLAKGLLRIAPVFIFAVILPKPLNLSFPVDIKTFILFIFALFIGIFLMVAIVNFTNVLLVKTLDDKGIINIIRVIADILSGDCVPVAFFPPLLKKITLLLPFCYVSDFPFRIYTSQVVGVEIVKGLLIQFIWAVILVILGNLLLKRFLKKVVVQGG